MTSSSIYILVTLGTSGVRVSSTKQPKERGTQYKKVTQIV